MSEFTRDLFDQHVQGTKNAPTYNSDAWASLGALLDATLNEKDNEKKIAMLQQEAARLSAEQHLPMTLGEIMGKSLSGFVLCPAYYLELTHGLDGFFPACIVPKFAQSSDPNDLMIICTDEKVLKEIANTLPKRTHKQGQLSCLRDINSGCAYNMKMEDAPKAGRFRLMTEERFSFLTTFSPSGEKIFEWDPGLL